MPDLLDFKPGTRVVYRRATPTTNHDDNAERAAVVVRPVKSRKVVTIKWADNGSWYDAYPANLVLA